MALKGTAVVELTNVKSGEKEVYKHDNLVTNAVSDILSKDPFNLIGQAIYSRQTAFYPVINKLIGGILLYRDPLEEDPAKYYPQESNVLVGYSSNDVNTGTDIRRGSLNQTESGNLEDGTGYRFVFDFATSQANGTISALGLTSVWGGIQGAGSMYTVDNRFRSIASQQVSHPSGSYIGYTDAISSAVSIVSYDSDNDCAYSIYVYAQKTLRLTKFRCMHKSTGLFNSLYLNTGNTIDSVDIETSLFAPTAGTQYLTLLDGGDGYIWGFQHSTNSRGNSTGNASIIWIKINKEDYTFEEGTWDVPATIFCFGQLNLQYNNEGAHWQNYAAICNGCLYCLSYNRTDIIKINLSNPSDVTQISTNGITISDDLIYYSSSYGYEKLYSGSAFNCMGNTVYLREGYIEDNSFVPTAVQSEINAHGFINCCRPGVHDGPFLLSVGSRIYSSNSYAYLKVLLPSAYLATINNLETPVQKTADKTMKITYIIREE